ncbi:MAG: FadR/GntR family transcriptional regulator [Thermomicrobiales bacterium]
MVSTELIRIPLSAQVAERLLGEILDGSFSPGSSFPSEGELVERFGVSRVVIREAIRTLEARGLVEASQGKRPTVIGLTASMPSEFFRMVLHSDASAINELIEVRQTLEVANARLAAVRATENDFRQMQEAIDAMRANRGQPAAYDAADVAFHEGVAAASGNRFHRLLIEALGDLLRASREESRRGHALLGLPAAQSIEAHQRILDALARRSPDEAANEMEAHLKTALADLQAVREEAARG